MNAWKLVWSVTRIVGAVIAVIAFAIGLFLWSVADWYPLNALAWHMRNGSVVRIGDFNIPIPRWIAPEQRFGSAEVSVPFGSRRFAVVSFEVGRRVTPATDLFRQLQTNANSSDKRVAEVAKQFLSFNRTAIDIAGQPTTCIEEGFEIRCLPDSDKFGLTATSLVSTPVDKSHFYEVLRNITRAKAR